jgi:hypothetical protein
MFRSPTRWHLPFEPYSPVQGWMATTGWNAVHSPVSFDCPGQARQGVPMRDLRLKGTSTPIRGANDAVLAHMGLQPHVFRIIVRTISLHFDEYFDSHASVARIQTGRVVSRSSCRQPQRCPHHTSSSGSTDRAKICAVKVHTSFLPLHPQFRTDPCL